MSKEAVIVATARTPIGRAYRGAFNDTDAPTLGGHVIAEAVRRAGIEPGEVDDVVMGCAMQQGTSGYNDCFFVHLLLLNYPWLLFTTIAITASAASCASCFISSSDRS